MPRSKLADAIADLAIAIEAGELHRVVTADESTLDAIRFAVRQWWLITDNAGLELNAEAEDVAREFFVLGATGDEPFIWANAL